MIKELRAIAWPLLGIGLSSVIASIITIIIIADLHGVKNCMPVGFLNCK